MLQNKTAVITGGSSGIGLATVKVFKENGATVLFTGRNPEAVADTAKETGTIGAVSDQADLKQIGGLVKRASQELGKVDILFLCAGTLKIIPFEQVTEEIYDDFVSINMKGMYFTLQKFLPILNDNAAVFLMSGSGTKTSTFLGSSLKFQAAAAVNSMVRTLTLELAPRSIRINAILPGSIETDVFKHAGFPEEAVHQTYEVIKAGVPLKRIGKAEDVAHLVAFLASDQASYINGVEYIIDGGLSRKAVF
ncbi:MAG TPA: SDR family oxidoreductase [Chitinophagaceae bacterium]|nr:SDR family oxidoreductase [Chitinophagaceae bacterium]